MQELFNGLYLYETVLLVLGVLLFLVLLLAFAILIIRGKPYSKLLVFFAVPIVMIGFPSIQSFEFSEGILKMSKYAHEVEKDPTNEAARELLAKEVEKISERPIADPQGAVTLARAQIALGDYTTAEANLDKALKTAKANLDKTLKTAPKLSTAIDDLKEQIKLNRNLADLTIQVESNPDDSVAKVDLANTLYETVQYPVANPEVITNVARAQQLLGAEEEARTNVNKALKINPKLAPAIQLKKQIKPIAIQPVTGNQ